MPARLNAFVALVIVALAPSPVGAQTSVDRYRASCDGGDAAACAVLGMMHELGAGVERDPSLASRLYERACEGGEARGCTNLGLLHERGLGVPRDLGRAAELHRRACDMGEALGCDLLAAAEQRAATGPGAYFKAGRVEDAGSGAGLPEAIVEIPSLGIRALSDALGRVQLGRLPAGRHGLVAERYGYEPVDGVLDVPGNAEFVIQMPPARMDDPFAPGRIVGRVSDEALGEGISNVEVAAGDGDARTLTSAEGTFTLREVEPGLVEVRLGRLGYQPRSTVVVVQPGATVELSATMSTEPIELAPVEVTVRSSQLDRSGFYRRAERGLGTHFTREDIDRLAAMQVSDLVRRVPGVTVRTMLEGSFAFSRRGQSFSRGPCALPVYVDGMRAWDMNLEAIPPEWIEAMEVYAGIGTPIEYGGCGAILIWTNNR